MSNKNFIYNKFDDHFVLLLNRTLSPKNKYTNKIIILIYNLRKFLLSPLY